LKKQTAATKPTKPVKVPGIIIDYWGKPRRIEDIGIVAYYTKKTTKQNEQSTS
jgi:hypothetical protein